MIVSEGYYNIQRDQAGNHFFHRPDGKAVPHCGYNLDDQVEADAFESDTTLNGSEVDPAVAEYAKNSRSFSGAWELSGSYVIAGLAAA